MTAGHRSAVGDGCFDTDSLSADMLSKPFSGQAIFSAPQRARDFDLGRRLPEGPLKCRRRCLAAADARPGNFAGVYETRTA